MLCLDIMPIYNFNKSSNSFKSTICLANHRHVVKPKDDSNMVMSEYYCNRVTPIVTFDGHLDRAWIMVTIFVFKTLNNTRGTKSILLGLCQPFPYASEFVFSSLVSTFLYVGRYAFIIIYNFMLSHCWIYACPDKRLYGS